MTNGLSRWKMPLFMNRGSLHCSCLCWKFCWLQVKDSVLINPTGKRKSLCSHNVLEFHNMYIPQQDSGSKKKKINLCTHKGNVTDFAKWVCLFCTLHFVLVLLPAACSLFTPQTHSLFSIGAPNSMLHTEVVSGHSSPLISTEDAVDSASPQTLGATSWSFIYQLV